LQTFGFQPKLTLRTVRNFYSHQLLIQSAPTINKRSLNLYEQYENSNGKKDSRIIWKKRQILMNQTDTNLYEQYENLYGKKQIYDGPNISPKIPQDQVFLNLNYFI
jgi:hypothetical protein